MGKVLAEFVSKNAAYLHDHGRTVIFWGEYPLKPWDIGALPGYVVNGETYGSDFDPVFRNHGIRQMVYTFTEAEEPMFPQYYVLPESARLHPAEDRAERVQKMLDTISAGTQADLLGVFVAGWADAGLHPETFWRGYVTGPAAGWHSGPSAQELSSAFDALFYGPGTTGMGRIYQLMSEGAAFWQDSWETRPSAACKPIWGDSYHIFETPHSAKDQFLPPLPVPAASTLRVDFDWRAQNARRLELAEKFLTHNDGLLDLLLENMRRTAYNRYKLEVFVSIANLYRQNLNMLLDLGQMSDALEEASSSAGKGEPRQALEALDRALTLAAAIRTARDHVLANTTATWYRSWFPRVAEANDRTYLHELDDVKDHQPGRTIDMSYLVYRELLYPLNDWCGKTLAVRNSYASAHELPQVRDRGGITR